MDPNLRIVQELRLQHRHADGSWSPMEPIHHGQPDHDPERSWLKGLIFRCTTCSAEVSVTQGPEEEGAPKSNA
jgi:hypothetical protein